MTAILAKFFRRESKIRDLAIQVILIAALVALCIAAIQQLQYASSSRGEHFSFSFLDDRAGYKIDYSVIDYDPVDSHARALLAGALNSLCLAVLVILFSTLFATAITLMRLSRNWALSTIARCYCNIFRNTPLVLQLPLLFSLGLIVLGTLPWSPRGMEPSFGTYFTSRGFYLPWITNLLPLTLAFLGSLAATFFLHSKLTALQSQRITRLPTWLVWVLPSIAVIAFAWMFEITPTWQIPELDGHTLSGGLQVSRELIIAVIAFSIYGSAQLSDIFYRHTIALDAKGLIRTQIYGARRVIESLPDFLPKLISSAALSSLNSYHTMFKNTALTGVVLFVGFHQVVTRSSNQLWRIFELAIITFAFYFVVGIMFKSLMTWVRSRPSFRSRPSPMYLMPTDSEGSQRPRADNILNWVRMNLIYDRVSTAVTLTAILFVTYLVGLIWSSSFLLNESVARRFECASATDPCWLHISTRLDVLGRLNQVLIGFLPPEETWPAYLTIALFFGGLVFCAFAKLSQRKLVVMILLITAAMWFLTLGFLPATPSSGLDKLGGLWLTLLVASLAIVAGFIAGTLLAVGSLSPLPLLSFLFRVFAGSIRALPPIIVIGPFVGIGMIFLMPEGMVPEYRFYVGSVGLIAVSAVQFAAVVQESMMCRTGFPSSAERLSFALSNCIPELTRTAVCQLHYTTFYVGFVASYDFVRLIRALGTGADWLSFYVHLTFFAALVYFLISNLFLFAGRRIEARRRAQLTS